MKFSSLKELYIDELKDMYDAENQIVKALPKLVKATSSPELQRAFEEHLEQTKGHVRRLEEIFESMGEKAKPKKCDGVRGILEEGEKLTSEDGTPAALDAGIIAGAQRVEHYEMAVYGSLKSWAGQLADHRATELLGKTLEEEKQADAKLTELARNINVRAAETVQAH